MSSLPRDLSIADCIVDVGEEGKRFQTMDEQHDYICKELIAMARDGHDKEDGWTVLSRVEPEGIDVYERKVSWSSTPQMRSRWTASCGMEKIAAFFLSGKVDESQSLESECQLPWTHM